jgi:hypothetical protein
VSSSVWRDLSRRWDEDRGALLDAYVEDTTIDDWQRAIDAVRSLDWPSTYSEDGDAVPMPVSARALFARSKEHACLWEIRPLETVRLNCHFFDEGEIEFDLDPREIRDEQHLDVVREFLSTVGRALKRPVGLGIEGGSPRCPDDLRYEPEADVVTVLPFA